MHHSITRIQIRATTKVAGTRRVPFANEGWIDGAIHYI